MLKTDRGGALSLIDDKRGNNAFYVRMRLSPKYKFQYIFFQFDPKIMIQMNSPEHGQGVGCGVEDDE